MVVLVGLVVLVELVVELVVVVVVAFDEHDVVELQALLLVASLALFVEELDARPNMERRLHQ